MTPNVKLIDVNSSAIEKVGYANGSLFVKYKFTPALYEYVDVKESVYEELLKSDSVGRFIALNIKGKYNFLKH